MGMLDDDRQESYRLTKNLETKRRITYEEARQAVLAGDYCEQCNGTGWKGHGMGGDTCGTCMGSGEVVIKPTWEGFARDQPTPSMDDKKTPSPPICTTDQYEWNTSHGFVRGGHPIYGTKQGKTES